jgi:CheY-like chemotaxis protein
LKLILGQRGHLVDIAEDGEQALSALTRHPYDVALIDFRLPKLDGLQVAQRFRRERGGETGTRLIAITADVEGLLSHSENCENFDQIIPKPLDVYEVCNVIERAAMRDGDEEMASAPEPAAGEPAARQTVVAAPMARRIEPTWALGLELLRWPEDFDSTRFAASSRQLSDEALTIDAILVRGRARLEDLGQIWERKPLHLFPVIDLTGALGTHADFNASKEGFGDGDMVRRLVQGFHQRRAQLHRDLVTTTDLGEKILARMFVRDAKLEASYNPGDRSLVRYNVTVANDELVREAEKLCGHNFLRREFFDRFHACYRCASRRLHVREECPDCHSADLDEQQYIHHFKCAYQGAETDFLRGGRLICPKCRQELTHFSIDYDKPGTVIVCGRCGCEGSEPAVGFMCMDCSAHIDSDAATTHDVHSYVLTEEGIAFVQMGNALRGPGQRTLRFSELPLAFVVTLNAAAKQYNEAKTPFTVLNLSYEREREIVRETGLRQFVNARDLFLENVQHLLGDRGILVKGQAYDFCLLRDCSPGEAEDIVAEIRQNGVENLRLDLGVNIQLFGPEDFA